MDGRVRPRLGLPWQREPFEDRLDGLPPGEQHFRRLVDSVSDCAIVALDRRGHVTSWNSGAERIFGHERTEIVGKPFVRLYAASDQATGKPGDDLDQAAAHGRKEEEGWRVRASGTLFWTHAALTALRDDTQSLVGFSLVVRDMTEWQRLVDRLVDRTRLEDRLNAVAEVNRAIVEGRSHDSVLQLIARRARQLVGAAVTTIVTPEPGGDLLVRVADGENAEALRGMLLPASTTLAGHVLRSRRPRVVPDLAAEPLAHPGLVAAGRLEAALFVPMIVRSRVIGVIQAANRRGGRPFNDEQMETVRVFAEQAAMAAEQNRFREQLQRLATAPMLENRPLGETLDTITQIVVDSTDTVASSIHLVDGDGGLWTAGSYGLPEALMRGMDEAVRPESGHPALEAIASRGPVLVDGLRERLLEDPHYRRVHPLLRRVNWSTVVCLPLLGPSAPRGAVCYYLHRDQRPGDAIDLDFLKVIAGLVSSVVENAQLLAAAREKVALEERQHLARELHDSVSQALYGIALGARTAHEMLRRDPWAVREPIDYVLQLAEAALAEMRALIFELRPESLETEGLEGALARQAEAVRARHGLAVETSLAVVPDVSAEVQQALYRIGQEALHNAARHSEARRVEVRLAAEDATIALDVIDDGVGFRPDDDFPGHLGLRSMRERALGVGGTLEVTSGPGGGTHVTARVPLHARLESARH